MVVSESELRVPACRCSCLEWEGRAVVRGENLRERIQLLKIVSKENLSKHFYQLYVSYMCNSSNPFCPQAISTVSSYVRNLFILLVAFGCRASANRLQALGRETGTIPSESFQAQCWDVEPSGGVAQS